MMSSLFSAVSGMKNHQTRMDVLGNNISNVNTIGFKAGRVTFQDQLSQTLQGASSASGNRGGTNPSQKGLGMSLASIDTIFTNGNYQSTGKSTDVAIQGTGFFVISDGKQQYYTRAGSFDYDTQGNYLIPGSGFKVMGWMANNEGIIDVANPIQGIQIPVGKTMEAKVTTTVTHTKNLSADAAIGSSYPAAIDIYDSLGIAHNSQTAYTKLADNTWISVTNVADGTVAGGGVKQVKFNSNGSVQSIVDLDLPVQTTRAAFDKFELPSTTSTTNPVTKEIAVMIGGKKEYVKVTATQDAVDPKKWDIQFSYNGANSAVQTIADVTGAATPINNFTIDGINFTAKGEITTTGPGVTKPTITAGASLAVNFTDFELAQDAQVGTIVRGTAVIVVDGKPRIVTATATKETPTGTPAPDNQWNIKYTEGGKNIGGGTVAGANGASIALPSMTIDGQAVAFDTDMGGQASAQFVTGTTSTVAGVQGTPLTTNQALTFLPNGGATAMNLTYNIDGITQYGGDTSIQATGRDGYAAGSLSGTQIDTTGTLVGRFTNGETMILGRIATATFNNPGGLEKVGSSLYARSNNSGEPQINAPGVGGSGSINAGTLEMSNVDLSEEFSNMIITQRGYQSNARVITTSDELLQELTNLKR